MSLPGALSALHFAQMQFFDPIMVWPATFSIPILDDETLRKRRKLRAEGEGILRIHVKSAAELLNVEYFKKSDPYCTIILHQEPPLKDKTLTINSNLNPQWNERFEFVVSDLDAMIDFSVKDYETAGKNRRLGSYSIEGGVSSLLPNVEIDCQFSLTNKGKEKPKGFLNVMLQWKPFVDLPDFESAPPDPYYANAILFVKLIRCENLISSGEARMMMSVGSKKEYTPYVAGASPTFQHSCNFLVHNVMAQRLCVEVEAAEAMMSKITSAAPIPRTSKGPRSLGKIDMLLADIARQPTGFQDRWQLSGVRHGSVELSVLVRFVEPKSTRKMKWDDVVAELKAKEAGFVLDSESLPAGRRGSTTFHGGSGSSPIVGPSNSSAQMEKRLSLSYVYSPNDSSVGGGPRPGLLRIQVHEAHNLPDVNGNGFSDPYVTLHCEKHKQKTKVIKKTINPTWDESFEFTIADANTAELVLHIKDHETLGKNTILGIVKMPLHAVGPTMEEREFDLESKPGVRTRGTFSMSCEFIDKLPRGDLAPDSLSSTAPVGIHSITAASLNTSVAPYATAIDSSLSISSPVQGSTQGPIDSSTPIQSQAIEPPINADGITTNSPNAINTSSTGYTGILKVGVISASGLSAANTNGFSDPYVIVMLDDKKQRSKTIKRTLHPRWEENFEFPVKNTLTSMLIFIVKDWELLSRDTVLGELRLPLTDAGAKKEHTLPLIGPSGSITFSLEFISQGEVPPRGADASNGSNASHAGAVSSPRHASLTNKLLLSNAVSRNSAATVSVPVSSSAGVPTKEHTGTVAESSPVGSLIVGKANAETRKREDGHDSLVPPTPHVSTSAPSEGVLTATSINAEVEATAGPSTSIPPSIGLIPASAGVESEAAPLPADVSSQLQVATSTEASSGSNGESDFVLVAHEGPGPQAALQPPEPLVPPFGVAQENTAAPSSSSSSFNVPLGTTLDVPQPPISFDAEGQHLVRTGSMSNVSVDGSALDEPVTVEDHRLPRPVNMTVLVLKVTDIKPHSGTTCDPHVSLVCEQVKMKTKTQKKTLNPEFKEKFEFSLKNANTAVLRVQVKDSHGIFKKSMVLGSATVKVESIHGSDIVVPLEPSGNVFLRVDFAEKSAIV